MQSSNTTQPCIELVHVGDAGAHALVINNTIVDTCWTAEDAGLSDIASSIAGALNVDLITHRIPEPSDPEWTFEDVLELLPPYSDGTLRPCTLHGDLILVTNTGGFGVYKVNVDTQSKQLSVGAGVWSNGDADEETAYAIVRVFNARDRSDYANAISGGTWRTLEDMGDEDAFIASEFIHQATQALQNHRLEIGSQRDHDVSLDEVDAILERHGYARSPNPSMG